MNEGDLKRSQKLGKFRVCAMSRESIKDSSWKCAVGRTENRDGDGRDRDGPVVEGMS